MNEMNNNRELGWEDEITKEAEFTLLPEGDYDFEVISMERGRSKGSEKLPPCNMAIVTLRVTDGRGVTTIKENLILHTSIEWKLSQFFISIGLKKHGEPLRMQWNSVVGKKGRCKVTVESYTDKYGETKKINRVAKYYDYISPAPVQTQATATTYQQGFIPGDF